MRRYAALRLAAGALAAASLPALASCSGASGDIASIWTDLPELAIAVELYDSSDGPGKVALAWKRDPAEALLAAKGGKGEEARPALVVGRRLQGAGLGDRLVSLDGFLKRVPAANYFYPELLAGGTIEGRLRLLPLSFNLPAIAFLRSAPASGDGFTLSLADLAAASAAYARPGAGERMGFSPRWDPRFLVAALDCGGARFGMRKEASQRALELGWDASGLASALADLGSWSARVNGSAAREDDFKYKYLYSPPYRWLKDGRALYAYMDSSELFVVGEERRAELDFRWFSGGGRVPISEGAVYAGLVRGAKGGGAALSFLAWLVTPEAQRAILERSRGTRAADYSFGILGGFSSVRAVNEGVFPAFYPDLVGHAPPAERLSVPAPLPPDWPALEAAVLEPWALEASARPQAAAGDELAARIADFRSRGSRQRPSPRASGRRARRTRRSCRP